MNQLGDYKGALDDIEQAIRLKPSNKKYERVRERLKKKRSINLKESLQSADKSPPYWALYIIIIGATPLIIVFLIIMIFFRKELSQMNAESEGGLLGFFTRPRF